MATFHLVLNVLKKVSLKPGAVITDPALKQEFYELLKEEAASMPRPLSMAEVKRFIEVDRRCFELHAGCRL